MLEGPLIWPGAREVILQLATSGEDVALIAADLRLPGMDGVAFLERAQELHRQASRVLLLTMDRYHTRLPFTESATLQQATALGRIDFWIVKGWVTPEESLYPQVQEALSAWTITHRPHHVMYRIVGEQWVPRSHDLRETLSRNGVPFAFYPVDSPQGQQLLRDFSVDPAGLPALIRHDGSVLHNPSFADIASAHGIEVQPADQVYDLAILGAGPAGLAAAVYGASALDDGSEAAAHAVILATGVTYRRLGIAGLERFVGTGAFYGAASVEAPALVGQEVYVVGGANSAGQAALHLAKFANRVTLLVRGQSLAAGMSDYLIRQLGETRNLDVRLSTHVVNGHGKGHLEAHFGRCPHRPPGGGPRSSRVRARRRGTAHRVAV